MLIKISTTNYGIGVPEITYNFGLVALPVCFLVTKLSGQDVMQIPSTEKSPHTQLYLVLRCLTGVASDVLMFLSFRYISYAKGFCFFFTYTLFAPFLARCILKEAIKAWDIIGISIGFTGMLFLM